MGEVRLYGTRNVYFCSNGCLLIQEQDLWQVFVISLELITSTFCEEQDEIVQMNIYTFQLWMMGGNISTFKRAMGSCDPSNLHLPMRLQLLDSYWTYFVYIPALLKFCYLF